MYLQVDQTKISKWVARRDIVSAADNQHCWLVWLVLYTFRMQETKISRDDRFRGEIWSALLTTSTAG